MTNQQLLVRELVAGDSLNSFYMVDFTSLSNWSLHFGGWGLEKETIYTFVYF